MRCPAVLANRPGVRPKTRARTRGTEPTWTLWDPGHSPVGGPTVPKRDPPPRAGGDGSDHPERPRYTAFGTPGPNHPERLRHCLPRSWFRLAGSPLGFGRRSLFLSRCAPLLGIASPRAPGRTWPTLRNDRWPLRDAWISERPRQDRRPPDRAETSEWLSG